SLVASPLPTGASVHAADTPAPSPTAAPTAPASGEGSSPSLPGAPAGATIDLQHTIESVRATIALAARQGLAQARIALQPRELGDIRIHLSQTADGLLARVTADSPAAAQVLADARGELHRSLSSLGVSLLRLDIGSFTQSGHGDREGRLQGGASSPSSLADPSTTSEEGEPAEEPAGASAGASAGRLVDVLA
ncbi:MAG TPA: flagellar hook-length control protein FliK, partial [Solirubrobacteraceae bacterium]|nr:flagellar hook-length control protein FliK [Solirubrobacteraceae bacterium]